MDEAIINIGKLYLNEMKAEHCQIEAIHRKQEQNAISLFVNLGALYERNSHSSLTNSLEMYHDIFERITNLDNLNTVKPANSSESKTQEAEELKRIEKIKNARIRSDGRYEWRKMINGVRYQVIDSDLENLTKKISEIKKQIKSKLKNAIPTKTDMKLSHLANDYYESIIMGEVKTKMIKPESAWHYKQALKRVEKLNRPITTYTKDDITKFLFTITQHRTGAYCYFLIRRVFANEFEKGTIKTNPIASLKNPFSQKRCGKPKTWLNLEEQKLLKQHLDDSIFSKEILFYLFTGCRLEEAFTAEINFEQCIAKINRKKTEYSGVKTTYIPLSQKFCDYIKDDWPNMFKVTPHHVATQISRYLRKIGIPDKTTHSLRHTFSSNVYYLGTDPKRHQYLMGHSTIKLTFDIYTTLDITIKKEDIQDIWGDWYPEF